jgi:DNA invertase Pin-like site-specific DNA recombinase
LIREREDGARLVANLKRGDHVVIAKLDRAFRRLSDCVIMLDQFERLDVHLHVCNMLGGSIDLSKPIGRFLIHILAAFAELERAFIGERISDGMRAKRQRGEACGFAPRPGHRWERRTRTRKDGSKVAILVEVKDTDEQGIIKDIIRLRTMGMSYDQIRQYLNYELKVKTRLGSDWTLDRIRRAIRQALAEQARDDVPRAADGDP